MLVMATCVYLACKIEECPHHIKMIVQETKHVLQGKHNDENIELKTIMLTLIVNYTEQTLVGFDTTVLTWQNLNSTF
jgi:transcription initiation factor TFIIIB Brf1 subunit/transcription initiation factor TFIIB